MTQTDTATRPRRRHAAIAVLIGLGALALAVLIEWLGWLLAWRLGAPRQFDTGWWWEFMNGVLRTASAAALVSAGVVLVLAALPPTRRWLRPRLLMLFGAGLAAFLLVILALTIWGLAAS